MKVVESVWKWMTYSWCYHISNYYFDVIMNQCQYLRKSVSRTIKTIQISQISPKSSWRAWAWTNTLVLWLIWSWCQGKVHRCHPNLRWSPARSSFETSQILKNRKLTQIDIQIISRTAFDMTFPHQRQLNLQRKCSPQLCPSRMRYSKPRPVVDHLWWKEAFWIKTWVREANSSCSSQDGFGYFNLNGPETPLVYSVVVFP